MALLASYDYTPGGLQTALDFLKRTRAELRIVRAVQAWKDRILVIDVNKDCFEIRGLGYADAEIVPLLQEVSAAYDPDRVHVPPAGEFKEFPAGRCHPWAEDRAM
jgi:hypothetical protein